MSKTKKDAEDTAPEETPVVDPEAQEEDTTPESETPVEVPQPVEAEEVNEGEVTEVKPTETAPDATGVNVAQVLANAGDVQVRNASAESSTEFQGFKVGQPAPATKWLDKGRVKVLDAPVFTDGVGSVLVQEGETVTGSILDQLKRGTEQ